MKRCKNVCKRWNVTNNNYAAKCICWHVKAQERLKTQHVITVVIINKVSLFEKNEIIYVNVSKTKADVFVATVLVCFCWNFLIFTRYLCNAFTRCSNASAYYPWARCPYVSPSDKRVDCDKTKESSAYIFIPYERTFILVFQHEEWLFGARPLVPGILGQNW